MSKLVVFSSSNRRVGETTDNFHVDFAPALPVENRRLVFRQLQIPNMVFNVTSADILDVGATPVPLTPGIYSMTTLASMTQSVINTALGAGTVTITCNQPQSTLTFVFGSATTLLFKTGPSSGGKNRAYLLMGFTDASGLQPRDSSNATTITSPQVCRFDFPLALYIDILIDEAPILPVQIGGGAVNVWVSALKGLQQQQQQRRATMIIPLIAAFGSVLTYSQNQIQLVIEPRVDSIRSVHFVVHDEDGSAVSLQNFNWWASFDLVDKDTSIQQV